LPLHHRVIILDTHRSNSLLRKYLSVQDLLSETLEQDIVLVVQYINTYDNNVVQIYNVIDTFLERMR